VTPTGPPSLLSTLEAGWENDFYRDLWMRHGVASKDALAAIAVGERFRELPIIRKDDLKRHGERILRWEDASDVVSSSGTTGRPVDIPLHVDEERNRVERVRKTIREVGVTQGSRVLDLLSLNDMFALGPQMWLAIKAEGALAIRCQAPRLKRVLDVVRYLEPAFVVGNPHVMVAMAEEGIESGMWPDHASLPKAAVFAVAATFDRHLVPAPVVQKVRELWGIEHYTSQYGCSEAGTLAHECVHHRGYHVNDEDTLIELIDPDTHAPAAPGEPGEVVLTALSLPRGFLPIRYGTNDIAAWLTDEPCACGRTSSRLGPVIGRRDHQLKIKGQTIFPELLLQVVDESGLAKHAAIGIRKNALQADEASILVVPRADLSGDEVARRVETTLARHLPVVPAVTVIAEDALHALEEREMHRTNGVKVPRILPL
jgi:phenylacetate-CoA ligase